MHLTRTEVSKRIPLERKGTKYVVRANINFRNAVPVLIALRDMLKLAENAKEAKEIIKQKAVKINGRIVEDYHDSIQLFNILEAGKSYVLGLTETGKFAFEEIKSPKERICKVIGKRILREKKQQINLHDGTNIVTDEKLSVDDSVYLSLENKITRVSKFQKGKIAIIISGKYAGKKGEILEVNEKKVIMKIEEKKVELCKGELIVL